MNEIKVGQMVELSNDHGTYVNGRVRGTSSGFYKNFAAHEPEQTLYFTVALEGISADFYDYEWTVVSVAGVTA